MNLSKTWMLTGAILWLTWAVHAQVDIITNTSPQCIFAGSARNVSVTFRNSGSHEFNQEVRMRIFQSSSHTAARLGEKTWKKLRVLPEQAVIESASLEFPPVKSETRFLVQWLEDSNQVLGVTDLLVYPTNLLYELKSLAGEGGFGVFDPLSQFKPCLKNLKLDFTDLETSEWDEFTGSFAIIGPFPSKAPTTEGWSARIRSLAKKGTAIVWIQTPRDRYDKLLASFYSIMEGEHAIVIVQPNLVDNFLENPRAQLNLIQLCRLAVTPRPNGFPVYSSDH